MNNEQIQEQQTSDGDTANASGLSSKEDSPMKGNKQSEETMHKKPKNLQQGFMLGATKVLDGAIGGLGVAVAAPVMGAKLGAEKNGFVGGTVGLLGGAAVGVIGAAGCLVGGAVKGAVDIKRGVEAVPASISAPRKGKWWNETTSTWVYTDITKIDVPENDDDILGGIENDLDATTTNATSGEVMDTYYYDTLEVDPAADPSKIKRQYYLMARKYHPDKNPGDAAAAEKFKAVAEAYQVLSDPELRLQYNEGGKDALSGDKTSGNDDQTPDPSLLLAFLFGSDRFNSFVGRLATSTGAMLGDTTQLSAKDSRTLQERRCSRLAITLAMRIKPWVENNVEEMEGAWKVQVEELKKTSYGWELLQVIGMAYNLAAVQFLGSHDSRIGIPSIKKWASGKVAGTRIAVGKMKTKGGTVTAALDLGAVQAKYRQKIEAASSEVEKRQLEQEMANASTEVMMRIIWTTTSVDIASTIHETCQMVFFDQSVSKEVRELRAKAVKKLGQIFKECPAPERTEREQMNAKKLFEEASMAATLETIKRKDEPNQQAS
eukprot:CAMPEP_0197184684 /NCGR_PEP_ID=MMETSP1423-20130617/10317_1 /TAXON_ID=476441 /ORGANISM="Pseudo-nitzschia heimii, Strain UNC1101" /LENGTH=545 /DNA_ID=CAMNT_0042635561 /DNA_START=29 /DNA_END=1666 /DNA_ORIENTATION=+